MLKKLALVSVTALTLTGCATVGAILHTAGVPAAVIDAINTDVANSCAVTATAATIINLLQTDGVNTYNAATYATIAGQVCSIVKPVPVATKMAIKHATVSAPVCIGQVNGVDVCVYGH